MEIFRVGFYVNSTPTFLVEFKGVRKTDFFLPLTYFGDYEIIDKKAVGEAVEKIRSMKQDEIRRMREFGCCVKCVDKVLIDKNDKCKKCKF